MKKILFIGVVLAAASLTSCTKDWSCTCTTTAAGIQVNVDVDWFLNATKENAQRNCVGTEFENAGQTIREECVLEVKK